MDSVRLLQMAVVNDRPAWVNISARRCRVVKEGSRCSTRITGREEGAAEELLRRALLDDSSAVAVSLRVERTAAQRGDDGHLPRPPRPRHAPDLRRLRQPRRRARPSSASELLRVPCDLDLADAEDRDEAERLYVEQATALRDALVGADTVLDVWREPLSDLAGSGVAVDHSVAALGQAARATGCCRRRWWRPSPSSSSRRCAAPARWPTAARRWGSPAPSRTSAASTRWPTTPSAASRTSWSSPPSTRSRWPSASITRRRRCSASWSSATR